MIGVREQDRQYRRGMVLGLTMAEIMLLLIFLLLLLLAAKLLADRKAVADAIEERDRAVAAKEDAEKKAAELEAVLRELKRKDSQQYDLFTEWQKATKELAETKEKLEEAETATELLEPVTKQAAEMSPDADPKQAMQHLQEAAMVGHQALSSGKSPDDLIAGAACQKDLQQCQASNAEVSKRLAAKGGTLPSCWVDENNRSQYIFNAEITDAGIILHDNKVAGHEEEQANLPIAPLKLERLYQSREFILDGQKLLEWSDSRACRFYVRLIDRMSNDKQRYKHLSEQGVQKVFYVLPDN